MILANELVAELLAGRRREALYRVHEPPEPQAVSLLLARLADLGMPTPPAPERHGPGGCCGGRRRGQRARQRLRRQRRPRPRGVHAARAPGAQAGALRPARTSATWASRARRTATSPRRSAATRTWSSTERCCASSASRTSRCRTICRAQAEHASERERHAAQIEYRADELCLAWLLERGLFELGWEATFEGEITGLIAVGLFVRFGDVFEGFVPARRLPGDYFELNELATALVGRRGGRTYRLGDPLEVRVADIRRSEGKVELSSPPPVNARAPHPLGGDRPPATRGERSVERRVRAGV